MSGAILGPRLAATARLALTLWAPLSFSSAQASTVVDTGRAQCCSSIIPEAPLNTEYGATIFRSDDPRTKLKPHIPLFIPNSAPANSLLAAIDEHEASFGVMSTGLVAPLGSLGAVYAEDSNYKDAIQSLRRAVHVARVNDGLHTPTQIPLLEQLIAINVEAGDYKTSDEIQRYLYRVRSWKRSADDPEMADAIQKFADWIRTTYLGDIGVERFRLLVEYTLLFDRAIEEVSEANGVLSPLLIPYLEGRVGAAYLTSVYDGEREGGVRISASPRDSVGGRLDQDMMRRDRFIKHNERYGLRALEHVEQILRHHQPDNVEALTQARLSIADWHQWNRKYAKAMKVYEEAWRMASSANDGGALVERLFHSPLELPLNPVFNPGVMPLQTRNTSEIAMRFSVTRHGEAKGIEILTETTAETQAGVTRAYHFLRNVRFRPRVVKGEVVRAKGLERRYQIRY